MFYRRHHYLHRHYHHQSKQTSLIFTGSQVPKYLHQEEKKTSTMYHTMKPSYSCGICFLENHANHVFPDEIAFEHDSSTATKAAALEEFTERVRVGDALWWKNCL